MLDAVFDPIGTGELDQARVLARRRKAGMLLLALVKTLTTTHAQLLIRCKSAGHQPLPRRLLARHDRRRAH